jgi:hypothetical protein
MKRRDLFRLFTAGLVAAQLPAVAVQGSARRTLAERAEAYGRLQSGGHFIQAEYAGPIAPGDLVGLCADGRVERCASDAPRLAGIVLSVADGSALVQIASRYERRFAEALS